MRHRAAWLLCAWVLWHESVSVFPSRGGDPIEILTIVEAYEKRSECDAAALFHAKREEVNRLKSGSYEKVTRDRTWTFWEGAGVLGNHRFRCLPAGTEPRARRKE